MFLIQSKLRQKVFTHFFINPERQFYVRELARLLDEDPGNLSKEMIRLGKEGIFRSTIRGKTKYYTLNKNHPLYKQLKEIIFKTSGIEKILKNELNKVSGIKEAFIYGSFARGEEKGPSDIDILIIGSVNEDALIDIINKLEQKFDREINYTLITKEEFQKKLKEKNSFLENILKQKKIKLL